MFIRLSSMALIAALLAACDTGPKSSRGFALPDGDAVIGQEVFVAMGCQSCHEVSGKAELRENTEPEMTITLGGETSRIASYGELVTSIINPSHRLSRRYPVDEVSENGVSKMTNYNDALTVSELIHLVAFLQAQYELHVPETHYRPYSYYQ